MAEAKILPKRFRNPVKSELENFETQYRKDQSLKSGQYDGKISDFN